MYVIYNETGNIQFTMKGELPEGVSYLEIPDQDLGDLTAWSVVEGQLVRTTIAPLQAETIAAINATIGEIRARYITVAPGQDPIYAAKEAEARDYIADSAPDMSKYPFLSAEVGVTAPDAYQLAQLWLGMASLWRTVASALERIRLVAINSVQAASTPEETATAVADFYTALSEL